MTTSPDAMRPGDVLHAPGFFASRAACAQQIPVEHFVDERRFAGAGNACDAGENAERNLDIDVLAGCARSAPLIRWLPRIYAALCGIGIAFRPVR